MKAKEAICKLLVPMKELPKLVNVREAEYLRTPKEFIDCVVLEPKDFRAIFGNKRAEAKDSEKTLAIVKIKSVQSGKVIYRRYLGEEALKNKNMAGVTYASIYLLDGGKNDMQRTNVVLSRGHRIPFYWHNPIYAVKISMRLGSLSLVLGFISLVLGVLSLCLSLHIL